MSNRGDVDVAHDMWDIFSRFIPADLWKETAAAMVKYFEDRDCDMSDTTLKEIADRGTDIPVHADAELAALKREVVLQAQYDPTIPIAVLNVMMVKRATDLYRRDLMKIEDILMKAQNSTSELEYYKAMEQFENSTVEEVEKEQKRLRNWRERIGFQEGRTLPILSDWQWHPKGHECDEPRKEIVLSYVDIVAKQIFDKVI